jgi:PAS domain-containing protein
MNEVEATQLLARPVWRDPRIHLLDDLWLLTIFAALFATAVPWLANGLAIDFLATAAGLLALGAIHVVLAALAGRGAERSRRRLHVLMALHALGVFALAYIWQHAGGLQNPSFLAVFALPIVGAIFISRWHPYLVATLAVIVVALLAAIEAPELRWYAPGVETLVAWVAQLLGKGSTGGVLPFAGFYAPADYFVVLLEVFAILMFACAVAAEYLGTVFERLHAQVAAALSEAERGEQLWSAVLEQLPLPAFVLDADTCEVRFASRTALARFGGGEDDLIGRSLFEALHFSYPELVHELVSGAGGLARTCMLRSGGRLLVSEVRVRHLALRGRRLALMLVQDTTESFCFKTALDVAEHAAIVVDSQGRVLAWNKPATALFPSAQPDADISQLLPEAAQAARWWDPGLSGRRKAHVTVMQRVYQLTCSAVPLPGEDERLYVVAFVPATHVASADEESDALTRLVRRP